jgi:putative NADH-flavin reductase
VKLAVVGATGATGRQVVEQALARGDEVTALVRRPEAVPVSHERLAVARADVLDGASLSGLLAGHDAVVSALGVGTQRAATTVYSAGTAHLLAEMAASGPSRIVVVSATPAGPWAHAPVLDRWVVYPLLQRLFGASYDDMRRMEVVLTGSDVRWTVVRPPRLLDKAAKGSYRISTEAQVGRSITRADLAAALLDVVADDTTVRTALSVAN